MPQPSLQGADNILFQTTSRGSGAYSLVNAHTNIYVSLLQFVVLRFFSTLEDDSEYFEVGLAKWLIGTLDDNMVGETKWPPKKTSATNLIKTETPYDPAWQTFRVQVMRFYGKFDLL